LGVEKAVIEDSEFDEGEQLLVARARWTLALNRWRREATATE
jgi:hypothetical protein